MTLVDALESMRRSILQSLISTVIVGSDLPILKRYALVNLSSLLFCIVADILDHLGVSLGVAECSCGRIS